MASFLLPELGFFSACLLFALSCYCLFVYLFACLLVYLHVCLHATGCSVSDELVNAEI